LAARINPSDRYAYFDVVQVWLQEHLPGSKLRWLRSQCGSGGLHVLNKPMRFNHSYKQRLQLHQPSREALHSIATLNAVHLNGMELSLDWTFDDEADRDDAFELVCRYHVKKHHRDQGVRFVRGVTRYTGPRQAPNVLATYRDKPSKVTGEVYCVHFDWRMKGAAVLHRAGINSIADLLNFKHREFWQSRLLMCALHYRDLGRIYRNQGTGRRRPWVIFSPSRRFSYDVDQRTGATIVRILGSTQAVIDRYRGKLDVRRCLVSINVRHLLPQFGETVL
jgi:hypothetical protein